MPKARLDSWKAIAEYLERSLRTVQRWHAHHGLPVHRFGGVKGAVFAYPDEIDRWLVSLAQEMREQQVSETEVLAQSRKTSREMTQTATQMWDSRSERNIQTIAALFRKAIDHDPMNDEALAGLANCMIFSAVYGVLDGAVAFPSARDALRRLSPATTTLPLALCAEAWLKLLIDKDLRQAKQCFDAALAVDSECTFALSGRALLYLSLGQPEQACAAAWKAWQKQPSVSSLGTMLCWVHALAGDLEQAGHLIEQVKISGGSCGLLAAAEGYILLCEEAPELRLEQMERLAAENPGNLLLQGMLGYLYGTIGRVTSAMEILFAFEHGSRLKRRTHGYGLALTHLGMGNHTEAVDWLEAARSEGSPWSLSFGLDPLLAPLRQNGWIASMAQRMDTATASELAALD